METIYQKYLNEMGGNDFIYTPSFLYYFLLLIGVTIFVLFSCFIWEEIMKFISYLKVKNKTKGYLILYAHLSAPILFIGIVVFTSFLDNGIKHILSQENKTAPINHTLYQNFNNSLTSEEKELLNDRIKDYVLSVNEYNHSDEIEEIRRMYTLKNHGVLIWDSKAVQSYFESKQFKKDIKIY